MFRTYRIYSLGKLLKAFLVQSSLLRFFSSDELFLVVICILGDDLCFDGIIFTFLLFKIEDVVTFYEFDFSLL